MSTTQCETSIIIIRDDLFNDFLRFNYSLSSVFNCLLNTNTSDVYPNRKLRSRGKRGWQWNSSGI